MEVSTNRIYLIRHGENYANISKEFSYKKIDYSLTPKGELQAKQTAEYLVDKNIHEIYASPLRRTRETAQIIATHLGKSYEVVEDFREVNVGSLEKYVGNPEDWKIHNQIINDWLNGKSFSSFPQGENQEQLWQRMRRGLKSITQGKSGRNMIIVAHGGIITFTMQSLCPVLKLSSDWLDKESHNCSVTEVVLERENGTLRGNLLEWAFYAHLHGKAAELVSSFVSTDSYEWEQNN